jgi:hypothetical protein
MKVKFFTIALAMTALFACQGNPDKNVPSAGTEEIKTEQKSAVPVSDSERNPALLGVWMGKEWLLNGKPSGQDAKLVRFEFKDDGTFKANFAEQHRNGTWRTSKDSLYTLEAGKKEIPIKLLIADGSSLDFEMNLRGKPEVIKFKKK